MAQTILNEGPEGVFGNCLQAAVASLLDLPLDAVPHFAAFDRWDQALILWASGRGVSWSWEVTDRIPERWCLVVGQSPRGRHVCVAGDRAIVWNPHPLDDGLSEISEAWFFDPVVVAG